MSGKRYRAIAVVAVVLTSLLALQGQKSGEDTFTGVCVKSYDSFSILFNGSSTVLISQKLTEGKVYTVRGRLINSKKGARIEAVSITEESKPPEWVEEIQGSYWLYEGRPYLLTPEWIKLSSPLQAKKGSVVKLYGVFYNDLFYPVDVELITPPSSSIKNGFPALVEGIILSNTSPAVLWNGTEKIYLYCPYGTRPKVGERVKVLGRVKLTSRINLYVDSKEDIKSLGYPSPVPVGSSHVGQLVEGECMTTRVLKSGIKLNCTELRLSGFKARVGDRVHFIALNTGSVLKCVDCSVSSSREMLQNGICTFQEGKTGKISGEVAWVKKYSNGFAIANVTQGRCWILLKLPKSLGVDVEEGGHVNAYGTFMLYRDMPSLQPWSGDDVCLGNC